ncbi:putative MFS transporter, AGZA family, xanthine/uracil permease [Pilibacter termitis]|uniref:Putative MFS transporter, AGZA family, xanthine/uracil permease n=1 Tax=Pilibacter termitis TaxID=263852 RepID=A0A1T4LCR9_9ENTE|nr:NCS2 family permease [Pilibacter termitis]SJZ52490.1 putative MFS transporter, AGZA family, xanthine/uracil permease [Pilibacter termitis]
MDKFFKLKENNTSVSTEFFAGVTTFFAMSYILFVNPQILSQAGMNFQAVFLATIIASVIGTLVMGLFANVPYALAPGMGLNAFFTFTVVLSLGYTWQQALAMVFICGLIDVVITLTKVRKMLIYAIPQTLQYAIGGGIGCFIAYIGIKNAGLLKFTADPGTYTVFGEGADKSAATIEVSSSAVPALVNFSQPAVLLALFGIALTAILVVRQVKAGILLSIVITTIVGILTGVVDLSAINWKDNSLGAAFGALGETFGVALGKDGLGSLFSDTSKIPQTLMTILAFALTNTFDAIGTLIGTGRKSGLFSDEDESSVGGFKTKMDRALIADFTATTIGSVVGTSNVTTYVESAAGIGAGGRTGLTSVFVAIFFALSSFLSPLLAVVPSQATAPVLIMVGVMMMSSFKEIEWGELEEAIPAFFASVFMGIAYSISYGIAAGFIFYAVVKVAKGKFREVHPILWVVNLLFILNWIILATM